MAILNNQMVFYFFCLIRRLRKCTMFHRDMIVFVFLCISIFLSFFGLQEPYVPWLVVYLPLWKI